MKTVLAWDANGNIYWTATGDGTGTLVAATTMTFDPLGNMLTVDGPLAGTDDTSRIRYDAARQVVGTVSPDPDGIGPLKHRALRNSYDVDTGLLVKVERGTVDSQSDTDWAAFSPAEAVETVYDSHARPIVGKLVSGSTVHALGQTSYDALGRPECTAQRMNPAVFGTVTATSACSLGPQGTGSGDYGPDRITKTTYDSAGQVYQFRTAVGTSDEANEVTTTYTANSQVETVTDGEGNRTSYEYDGHDRLTKTYFPLPIPKGAGSSNGADYEQLTYESLAGGARTSSTVTAFRNRANQTIGFGYDALGRLTSKDLPGSEPDVSYGYDLLGRMSSASQTGHALGFTYDALGRKLTETGALGTFASEYDLAGRRTKLAWPDGFYVTYDYLVTGEMTAIRESGATSGAAVLATFAYDQLGRRTSLTRGNGTVTTYSYDPVSRLQQMTQDLAGTTRDQVLDFTYNPASQIASTTRSNDAFAWTGHGSGTTTATSNGLNQIGSWVGSIGYDSKGNVTIHGSSGYAFSSENLLTAYNNPANSLQTSATYSYDPLMRLSAIDSSNSVFDVQLGHDGQDVALEDSGGGKRRRYVHGPGIDEPLMSSLVTTTGTFRDYYHADERGSIVSISNAAGVSGITGSFDEYGAGTGASHFHYAGQYWLVAGEVYYSRARNYNPKLGRFLQPDPIGYGGGMNMYAYVGGDPVNFTDPLGLGEDVIGKEEQIITITGNPIKLAGSGATYPPSGCGNLAAVNPVCTPVKGVMGLDDFMFKWWLTGVYSQWKVRYDILSYEPTFYVYEGLEVEEAKVEMKKITCTNGTTADQGRLSPPDSTRNLIAIAHWHQGRGMNILGVHDPYPGIGDGFVVKKYGIPNYVFADLGLTVVRPGPGNTVAGVDILGNNGLPSGPAPTPTAVTGGGGTCP